MKLDEFLSIVPRAVRIWALVLAGCELLLALAMGVWTAVHQSDLGPSIATMVIYGIAAFALCAVLAVWLLCLGFVFGDARRRDMQPVLWVLVAALVPHLLGFLLYFVMRQPIASICAHCGRTISNHPRFCPWCGVGLVPSEAASGPLAASPSQGASL
jgi:hypothetical protein